MAKTYPRVDTSDYVREHGKNPRGRGGWMFCKVDPRQGDYLEHLLTTGDGGNTSFWGTYSEASKAARMRGFELGLEVVYVCA